MDNIPEREQVKEPRRGIVPFAGGIKHTKNWGSFETIRFNRFQFGALGKANILLIRPLRDPHIPADDLQAFTIDLSGKIHRGKLLDYLKDGYYQVNFTIDLNDIPIDEAKQKLYAHFWINNTEPVITLQLQNLAITDFVVSHVALYPSIRDVNKSYFVLPNNPEVWQTIRMNVTNQ